MLPLGSSSTPGDVRPAVRQPRATCHRRRRSLCTHQSGRVSFSRSHRSVFGALLPCASPSGHGRCRHLGPAPALAGDHHPHCCCSGCDNMLCVTRHMSSSNTHLHCRVSDQGTSLVLQRRSLQACQALAISWYKQAVHVPPQLETSSQLSAWQAYMAHGLIQAALLAVLTDRLRA